MIFLLICILIFLFLLIMFWWIAIAIYEKGYNNGYHDKTNKIKNKTLYGKD